MIVIRRFVLTASKNINRFCGKLESQLDTLFITPICGHINFVKWSRYRLLMSYALHSLTNRLVLSFIHFVLGYGYGYILPTKSNRPLFIGSKRLIRMRVSTCKCRTSTTPCSSRDAWLRCTLLHNHASLTSAFHIMYTTFIIPFPHHLASPCYLQ